MTSYTVRNADFEHDIVNLLKLFHSKDSLCNLSQKRRSHIDVFGTLAASRFIAFEANNPQTFVAFASFAYIPNLPALPSDCWPYLLKKYYCIEHNLNMSNTMFVYILIYHKNHEDVLKDLFARAFLQEFWIHYCVSIQMPTKDFKEIRYNDNLEKYGRTYYPRGFSLVNFSNALTVNVIDKKDIVVSLNYRVALPGDNDDAMEILKVDRPDLYRKYGEYYIAEIVLKAYENDEKVELVMGEIRDNIVGYIWINENFDIYEFIANYDLVSFGNLVNCTQGQDKTFEDVKVNEIPGMSSLNLEEKMHESLMESDSSCVSFPFKSPEVSDFIKPGNTSRFYELERIFMRFHHMYETPHHFYREMAQTNLRIYYDLPLDYCNGQSAKEWTLKDAKNAFLLRLCSVKPGFPKKQLMHFLCSAFAAFPERDYCLLLSPMLGTITPTMRELLKYFLPLPKRLSNKTIEDCFILHRSTLFGELWLHELREEDVMAVYEFIGNNPDNELDMSQLNKYDYECRTKFNAYKQEKHQRLVIEEVMKDVLNGSQSGLNFFVIRAGNASNPADNNAFAGFVIVGKFVQHHLLQKHFSMPSSANLEEDLRGEIHVLKLHPFFHIWSQEIIRALAVKTDYHEFYYIVSSTVLSLDNDLVRNMMPIEPRRKKKYWFNSFNVKKEELPKRPCSLENLDYTRESLQVFYATIEPLRLLGNKRKIVIIGFSKYCKAFLRLMVFNWNADNRKNQQQFCCAPDLDITVIESSSVIEADYDKNFRCKYCKFKKDCYIYRRNSVAFVRDTTRRMDLRRYVRFIAGPVMKILRKKRALLIGKEYCTLYYDTLLLMCDCVSGFMKGHGSLCHFFPYNYIKINNRIDRLRLYYKTQALINSTLKNYRIIVYGFHIRMFECLNFLLTHGVPSTHLLLCLPPIENLPRDSQEPDRDLNTEYILLCMAIDLGIFVQFNHQYVRWHRYENENIIRSVVFEVGKRPQIVEYACDLFIHFDQVYMDQRDFRIFQKSGIEMRNRQIFVNERYQTNDQFIYALGRYIHMRHIPNYQYICVNEHEAASKLIQILGLIPEQKKDALEQRYSKPYFFKASLFNGHFFTKLIAPKRYVVSFVPGQNKVMQTYNEGDFTRVVVNPNGVVKEITVLCRQDMDLDFLEHFCGQHVSMLNHILERWELGTIKNLLDYFKMPWVELIMHENFNEKRLLIRSMIYPTVQNIQFMHLGKRNWEQFLAQINREKSSRTLQEIIVQFVRENRSDFVNEFALPEDFKRFY